MAEAVRETLLVEDVSPNVAVVSPDGKPKMGNVALYAGKIISDLGIPFEDLKIKEIESADGKEIVHVSTGRRTAIIHEDFGILTVSAVREDQSNANQTIDQAVEYLRASEMTKGEKRREIRLQLAREFEEKLKRMQDGEVGISLNDLEEKARRVMELAEIPLKDIHIDAEIGLNIDNNDLSGFKISKKGNPNVVGVYVENLAIFNGDIQSGVSLKDAAVAMAQAPVVESPVKQVTASELPTNHEKKGAKKRKVNIGVERRKEANASLDKFLKTGKGCRNLETFCKQEKLYKCDIEALEISVETSPDGIPVGYRVQSPKSQLRAIYSQVRTEGGLEWHKMVNDKDGVVRLEKIKTGGAREELGLPWPELGAPNKIEHKAVIGRTLTTPEKIQIVDLHSKNLSPEKVEIEVEKKEENKKLNKSRHGQTKIGKSNHGTLYRYGASSQKARLYNRRLS